MKSYRKIKRLMDYSDVQNVSGTAFGEGVEKGGAEGKIEGRIEEKHTIAKNMLAMGLAADIIAQTTGLSLFDIQKLNAPRFDDRGQYDE